MKEILRNLGACNDAKRWANGKTWKEIHATCHRGDWLLWLFKRTNPEDLQLLTLAKGHCANTVRHLMKDERSIAAVDAAIAFGNGEILEQDLRSKAAAAYAAAYAAADYAAYAADYAAAYAADYAAADYAAADYAAAYAAADYADYAAARKKNQMLTADICRQHLPIEKWNIDIDM